MNALNLAEDEELAAVETLSEEEVINDEPNDEEHVKDSTPVLVEEPAEQGERISHMQGRGRGDVAPTSITTDVPSGESATVFCSTGETCCVKGSFNSVTNNGDMTIGGDDNCADMTMSKGKLVGCEDGEGCSLNCSAGCDVSQTTTGATPLALKPLRL